MAITDTYDQIVSMVGDTSGIVTASTAFPTQINEGDLPLSWVAVGPAVWSEQASGLYRQQRTYTITTLVQPVALGVDRDEGYRACLTPLYNVGRTFVTDPTLSSTVDHIGNDREYLRDGGVSNGGVDPRLQWGGTNYWGFVHTMDVVEKAT